MSSQTPTCVTLERNGRTHNMQLQQVNVANLRRVFQVDPSEVWLRDDCDGTAYFPHEGHFNLHSANLTHYTILIVEGPDGPRRQPSSSAVSISSTPVPSSLPPPPFRSVTATRRAPTFSLKVVKASMCRQGMELTEATATLAHILGVITSRWGQDYTLVTNDGLEIEDSTATQGLTFWKKTRRKLFAVVKQDPKACVSKKRAIVLDSDEDDFEPTQKNQRCW